MAASIRHDDNDSIGIKVVLGLTWFLQCRKLCRIMFLRAAVLLIVFAASASAQTPIPAKYDGFAYGESKHAWGDSVMVEAFLDPMCPDSRDSWAPLKQALEYYSPRVSLIVHPFPLPYHSNSFTSCRALHIANKMNSSTTFPLLELYFENQEKFYNAPTYNMSTSTITEDLSKLAVAVIGENSFQSFLSGFNDYHSNVAAIISFKYGCSRGVPGTPFFFVNGIPLPGYGSALDFPKWRSIIDPLVA